MTVGDKIRSLLAERGWSHAELARRAGLHQRAVSYMIAGEREPRVRDAVSIARTLGVPIAWLFDDEQPLPPPPPSERLLPADITERTLVDELARRRELIRKDMRAIASDFTEDRCIHLDRVAAFGPKSKAQEQELHDAMEALFLLEMLSRRLAWLDPDQVHRPSEAKSASQLAEPYGSLFPAFQSYLGSRGTGVIGLPSMKGQRERSAVPNYHLHGGVFPRRPELTVTTERVESSGRAEEMPQGDEKNPREADRHQTP